MLRFILIILFTNILFAQDKPDFYKKDYAKTPIDKSKAVKIPAVKKNVKKTLKEDKKVKSKDKIKNAMELSGKKVKWIGGIISAQEEDHLKKHLKELFDIYSKYNFNTGVLYILGYYSPSLINHPHMEAFEARGGHLRSFDKIPAKYPIKLSPAWIVNTEEGEYLLEATGELASHFNSKGEFLRIPVTSAVNVVETTKAK